MGNVYNLCRVQTVLTAVLTVMSGMDPHMIRWDLVWLLRFCWSVWWFTVGVTVILGGSTMVWLCCLVIVIGRS